MRAATGPRRARCALRTTLPRARAVASEERRGSWLAVAALSASPRAVPKAVPRRERDAPHDGALRHPRLAAIGSACARARTRCAAAVTAVTAVVSAACARSPPPLPRRCGARRARRGGASRDHAAWCAARRQGAAGAGCATGRSQQRWLRCCAPPRARTAHIRIAQGACAPGVDAPPLWRPALRASAAAAAQAASEDADASAPPATRAQPRGVPPRRHQRHAIHSHRGACAVPPRKHFDLRC